MDGIYISGSSYNDGGNLQKTLSFMEKKIKKCGILTFLKTKEFKNLTTLKSNECGISPPSNHLGSHHHLHL